MKKYILIIVLILIGSCSKGTDFPYYISNADDDFCSKYLKLCKQTFENNLESIDVIIQPSMFELVYQKFSENFGSIQDLEQFEIKKYGYKTKQDYSKYIKKNNNNLTIVISTYTEKEIYIIQKDGSLVLTEIYGFNFKDLFPKLYNNPELIKQFIPNIFSHYDSGKTEYKKIVKYKNKIFELTCYDGGHLQVGLRSIKEVRNPTTAST